MTDQDGAPWLTCFRTHPHPNMPIVPAASSRQWMDRTHDRHAYRCLPLLIANQNGWFILSRHHVRIIWNGESNLEAVKVECLSGPTGVPCSVKSHFGHGVVTWDLNCLFRTSPGYNLWIKGPSNWPKDGVSPLEGIIETDWAVATFTMNWKITRPNFPNDFEVDEPICMIAPIRRGELESFLPQQRDLHEEPELSEAHRGWARSRGGFIEALRNRQSSESKEKWQKDYFRGKDVNGTIAREHQSKLEIKSFQLG